MQTIINLGLWVYTKLGRLSPKEASIVEAKVLRKYWRAKDDLAKLWGKTWIGKLQYKLKRKYYDLVPYEYRLRLKDRWYYVKCFLFKRYTTVKSRHLAHTWTDKCETLPYTMFEILERFLEEECAGYWWEGEYREDGIVQWRHEDGHKVVPGEFWTGETYKDPRAVYAIDEMREILRWWNERYLKWYPAEEERLLNEMMRISDIEWAPIGEGEYLQMETIYKNGATEEMLRANLQAIRELEEQRDRELEEYMIRLVRVRRLLWT